MASPKTPKSSVTATGLININLRLPEELLAEIDQQVEKANQSGGWPKLTRTDLIRNTLADAAKGWKEPPAKVT